jgi:predicted translin family RNA/ssDNA-binding protein
MIDPKYFGKVREELLAYAEKRREVIKMTGDAQHQSKRAIFALQRDDAAEAKKCLGEAENLLMSVNKKFQKDQRLFNEGSYRASLEEFAEAMLFNQFLNGKSIGEIKGFKIDPDLYISGLADVPGEILRYAIKSATERNFLMVKKML